MKRAALSAAASPTAKPRPTPVNNKSSAALNNHVEIFAHRSPNTAGTTQPSYVENGAKEGDRAFPPGAGIRTRQSAYQPIARRVCGSAISDGNGAAERLCQ